MGGAALLQAMELCLHFLQGYCSTMDLGKIFGAELEQAASPLTGRVDDVIARIKRIEILLVSIDSRLKQLQPLVDLLKKFRLV
jgi:hypothetical protein